MIDARRLANEILAFLPEDGTPVLNRVMRVMLARKLEEAVDEDKFFAARDALLAKGLVGRLRGQGGQTFLTKPDPVVEKVTPPPVDSGRSSVPGRLPAFQSRLCQTRQPPGSRWAIHGLALVDRAGQKSQAMTYMTLDDA